MTSGRSLLGDLRGAVAVSMVSLPIGMVVGTVAFAPLGKDYLVHGALAGLYGGAVTGFVAAALGARTVLVSGPRAASALVLGSLLTQLLLSEDLMFPSGTTVQHVMAIGFFAVLLAGALQVVSGIAGLARVIKNIPYPVISGFLNSSALLILLSQVWVLLDIPRQDSLWALIDLIGEARPVTALPAAVTIAAMLSWGRWGPWRLFLPPPMVGFAAGTMTFYFLRWVLDGADVGATLGEVTTHLPALPVPEMFTSPSAGGDLTVVLMMVIPAALSMAALAALDSLFSLSTLDEKADQHSDSDRELIGQGAGNMVSAAIGGIVGAGGLIRTTPGVAAGGRSHWMGMFASVIMLALIFMTAQYMQYIPRAAIAGMVVVLGIQIFDRWGLVLPWRLATGAAKRSSTNLMDMLVIILVITVAIAIDLIHAVGVGLALALLVFVARMSKSLIRAEYRGPGLHSHSHWSEHRQALLDRHGSRIAELQLEGPIFFGTADELQTRVFALMRDGVTHLVLNMKRVNDIDSTGMLALRRINDRLRQIGGHLAFGYVAVERRLGRDRRAISSPSKDVGPAGEKRRIKRTERRKQKASRRVWTAMSESGFLQQAGANVIFPDMDSALVYCEDQVIAAAPSLGGENGPRRLPGIFKSLTRDDLRQLKALSSGHVIEPGETVFREGDAGDAMYLLCRGRLSINVLLPESGEVKRVQCLPHWSLVGEMAVLDGRPRAATVTAETRCFCYRLPVENFENLLDRQPGIAIKLMNNMSVLFSERLRSSNALIAELEK